MVFLVASDTSENYYPMLFSTDLMLEEMYSVCIQLVNKTWKEMRATSRDFSRVSFFKVMLFIYGSVLCLTTSIFSLVYFHKLDSQSLSS